MQKPCKCGHRSKGYKDSDFDPKQLAIGTIIEFEHTCNEGEARNIARDHLSENSMYYQELLKMERKLDKMKNKKELPDKRQNRCT